MSRVYKYVDRGAGIEVPGHRYDGDLVRLVGIDPASGRVAIWVEHKNPDHMTPVHQVREFRIFGTGHDVPHRFEHVGSVIDGQYVWHVFENTLVSGSSSSGAHT